MKKILLALVLFLAFASTGLAGELPELEANEAESAVAQSLQPSPGIESLEAEPTLIDNSVEQALPQSALSIATDEAASGGYSCPSYTIYCFRDNQCNNYCGAPGAGACVNGCCACAF